MIENIKWLGHGSFIIEGPPIIYIDPWRVVKQVFHPDVILVTHDHYDHFSSADVSKLTGPDTRIITNDAVASQLDQSEILRPWQSLTVDRASIKAVPAYSTDGLQHPKEAGGLGFIVSVNLFDIYYAGGTQIIPEMDLIRPDIAILPIEGNGALSIEDAVQVVRAMQPRWVLPCNWGSSEGATHLDAKQFRDLASDYAEVVIPELTR